jgi:hypothetical protein
MNEDSEEPSKPSHYVELKAKRVCGLFPPDILFWIAECPDSYGSKEEVDKDAPLALKEMRFSGLWVANKDDLVFDPFSPPLVLTNRKWKWNKTENTKVDLCMPSPWNAESHVSADGVVFAVIGFRRDEGPVITRWEKHPLIKNRGVEVTYKLQAYTMVVKVRSDTIKDVP